MRHSAMPITDLKKNVPWHILAPRRGCFGNHLPLRRVRILVKHLLSYGNEVSYPITIECTLCEHSIVMKKRRSRTDLFRERLFFSTIISHISRSKHYIPAAHFRRQNHAPVR